MGDLLVHQGMHAGSLHGLQQLHMHQAVFLANFQEGHGLPDQIQGVVHQMAEFPIVIGRVAWSIDRLPGCFL